jgi:hypothetical protein
MTDTTLLNSPLELTTILLRHHGIHKGLWTLTVSFHVQGSNFRPNDVDGPAFPGAMVAVQSVGIRQVEVADALTVDAAAVNPAPGIRASSPTNT